MALIMSSEVHMQQEKSGFSIKQRLHIEVQGGHQYQQGGKAFTVLRQRRFFFSGKRMRDG